MGKLIKYLLIISIGFLLFGCISPTVTKTTTFDISTGKKLKEVVIEKYQPHATKSIGFGLRIGIDIETKTPVIWFGVIKRDINLLLGSGNAKSSMEITNKK